MVNEYILASFEGGKKADLLGRGKKGITGKENDRKCHKNFYVGAKLE